MTVKQMLSSYSDILSVQEQRRLKEMMEEDEGEELPDREEFDRREAGEIVAEYKESNNEQCDL